MKPEIIYLPLSEIKPYENNPRYNESAVDAVAQSIKEFGFKNPIILDKHKVIIAGHTRYKASQQLGLEEVPCIIASDLTDQQAKAYRLVDNKVGELAEWDFIKLSAEIEGLPAFSAEEFGFDMREIDAALNKGKEAVEDDYEEPDYIEPRIKRGEVWQLGNHRLMCGDSAKEENVAKLMNGNKADMVFTDPPYGMNLDTDWSGAKSKLQFYQEKGCKGSGNKYERVIGDNEDFKPELVATIFNNFDYCKEIFVWGADYYPELLKNYKLGNMFVWDKRSNDDTNIDYVEQSDKMFGSQFELCWSKNKHRKQIARVKWAGIFGTEKEFDKKRVHPTQKPTTLSSWFIDKYSKENDLIVDLFGGSGSTLIACEQLNRNCYMMELDEHYANVIIDRWETYTGKNAEKIC
jgi:site-specific DNA-methyltransferase (adenine-specific)